MRVATGALNQYSIARSLQRGLRDKRLDEYPFHDTEDSLKYANEYDCAICFSSATSYNNPIIYCTNSK